MKIWKKKGGIISLLEQSQSTRTDDSKKCYCNEYSEEMEKEEVLI